MARGLLPEAEAASARLEIERRLLAAAGPAGVAAKGGRGRGAARAWLGAGLLLLLLPPATVAIYLDVGSPDLPAFPFADRTAPPAPAGNQQMAAATAQLEAAMKAHPEDPKGWALLAGSEGQLGRYAEAAAAYGKSIALLQAAHQPVAAILPSLQGEALAAAAEGQVTPAAKAAFEAALAIDPKDPRGALLSGPRGITGRPSRSRAWRLGGAGSRLPADAPWRPMVAAEIEETAKKLGPRSGDAARPQATTCSAANLCSAQRSLPLAPGGYGQGRGHDAGAAGHLHRRHGEGFGRPAEGASRDIDGWLRLATA